MTEAIDNLPGDPGTEDPIVDPQPPADPGGDGAPAWMAQLPDDLKGHEGLSQFATIGDVSKAFLDSEGKLEGTIKVPGENATKEDLDGFFTKLGRPEQADGYDLADLEVPTSLDIDPAPLRQTAFDLGMTQNQAKGFLKALLDAYMVDEKKIFDAADAERATNQEMMKKAWGENYDAKVISALRVLGKGAELADLDSADYEEYLKTADFRNDAKAMIALGAIADAVSEDTVLGIEAGAGARGQFSKDQFGRTELSFPNTPGME